MRHYQRGRRAPGRIAVLLVVAGAWCLVGSSFAQDFDFYAMDLIAQQSYRKISMDFRDASLKDILRIFSEQAGLNFIASQGIEDRTVTLFLDEVPLNDALKKIMAANNLTYELEAGSNVFIVRETGKPDLELITRVYPLRYARLKSSKLSKRIKEGPSAGSGLDAEAAANASASDDKEEEVGIEAAVRNVLTERGKLLPDDRTNSLVVTDIAGNFDVIEKVIRILDAPVPQVMIEVEMLDVSKLTMDELGVDMTSSILTLRGGAKDTRFPNFFADSVPIHENALSSFEDADTAPAYQYGKLSAESFVATLDFLRTDTSTKFLARPRILTMSNETAEIKISTNEAIGQQTVVDQESGTKTTSAERFETGVLLKVTPQVDPEVGHVTLFIEPTVVESRTGATFAGVTYKDPEIRSAVAALMVKDGETIVVGGLIRTRYQKVEKKMPILGDIPIIGMMFRHKDESEEERELLVFITPRIVGPETATALAQSRPALPRGFSSPAREQTAAVSRKRKVDSYLERWEN